MNNRDEFKKPIRDALAKRAAYICANPDCKKMTIAPSTELATGVLYFGRAAHITSAAKGGPRYDASLTPDQRSGIGNGIFLCANCADMIDDNMGADFGTPLLHQWKQSHDDWTLSNLNKGLHSTHETVDILRQMSGGQSTLHLCYLGGKLYLKLKGDLPLRDVELSIRDETEFTAKLQFIERTRGNGMSADSAVRFTEEATIYRNFFPVLDIRAPNGVVSPLTIQLPPLAAGEARHYSYRATALNGIFVGAVFLCGTADGRFSHAHYGFIGEQIIDEFPENYPKVEDSRVPDWGKFSRSIS